MADHAKRRMLLMADQLQRLVELAERPPQPWSRELLKALSRRARRLQEPLRTIEPHQLEQLLLWQEFRCAYSKRRLILPDESDLFHSGTYERWLAKLEPVNYRQAAVLVRLDVEEPWQRGNLMFLSAPWAVLHDSCTSLSAAVLEIREVADRLSEGRLAVLPADKYYEVTIKQ